MKRRKFIETTALGSLTFSGLPFFRFYRNGKLATTIQQITTGSENHLFGYIGQSLTIPWNLTGSRILTLSSPFIDHLPDGNEPAGVCLVNTDKQDWKFLKVEKADESLGWNTQQGTMFYWNPENPENQFFSTTAIKEQEKRLLFFLIFKKGKESANTALKTHRLGIAEFVLSENHF